MKINIKSTNISLNNALRLYIQKKIEEIEKFLGKFGSDDFLVGGKEKVEAWVEIGKTTRHHLKGDVFRAEIQLYFLKRSLRAEAVDTDLRTAINTAAEEIQREIKRYKKRRISRARKWARKIKENMRTTPIFSSKKSQQLFRVLRRGKKK